MELRKLNVDDVPNLWAINEEGLPGVGQVSEAQMADLLSLCEHPIGAIVGGELAGFVLCLRPRTRYGSLNYAWFNERYDHFLYVDRIAVAARFRDNRVGTVLYEQVIDLAQQEELPIAAEVSLKPPNPGSMRFHGRHGFDEVGIFEHGDKAVTMMMRSTG